MPALFLKMTEGFSTHALSRILPALIVCITQSACTPGSEDVSQMALGALISAGNGSTAPENVTVPTGVMATGGNGQISISWNHVPGATSYNLYWGTAPGVTKGGGTKIANAIPPYTHIGLPNGTEVYYIVAAVGPGGEGNSSTEVLAYPSLFPLKTYQTYCLDPAGTFIVCNGTGQDGQIQAGRVANFIGPVLHAIYPADYTTTDNDTGLVWKACSEGLSGTNCTTGTALRSTWDTATAACAALNTANGGTGYAGKSNWRVPTVEELETLINYSIYGPTIFSANFPGTYSDDWWSSSTNVSDTSAWIVSFLTGGVTLGAKAGLAYVRCVSGSFNQGDVFIENGDGSVTDRGTGLVWQRCGMGQNNDTGCSGSALADTWTNALSYCNGLALGGRTWRLPNVNELKSITNRNVLPASISTASFPSTVANHYWASSTVYTPGLKLNAWSVNFGGGIVFAYNAKSSSAYVRCVSGP
jgi:hypothetical protein